jgi:hypothetical protein
MSGSNIPYQLRPNKAVERFLWMEALDHVNKWTPLIDFVYVSMGGRYLEDFKLVHSRFGTRRLYSIEMDEVAYNRQVFNKPISLLECLKTTTGDFVKDFANFSHVIGHANYVFWFDYAVAKARLEQLQEIQSLVSKLEANDVVKLTMNAELKTLGSNVGFSDRTAYQKQAAAKLADQLAEYCPDEGIPWEMMTQTGMASLLSSAVKNAFLRGLAGTPDLKAVPIASFRYSDGQHQMLTVVAIILNEDDSRRFESRTQLSKWPFRSVKWEDVHEVKVPDLTVKERMAIDQALFADSIEGVHAALPFKLDENEAESLQALKNYETHYRRYPQFLRVNL